MGADALVDAVFCAAGDPGQIPWALQAVLAATGGHFVELTLTNDEGSCSWAAGALPARDITCRARVETTQIVLSLGTTGATATSTIAVLAHEVAWYFAKAFHDELEVRALEARSRDLALVLERVSLPLLVLDGSARIRLANAAAYTLLREADAVREANGKLVVAESACQRALLECVRDGGPARVLSVRRARAAPLGALLVPLGHPRRDRVLVAFHDSEAVVAVDASWLQRLCGLTSTERALVEALAQGRTVQEFATSRDCSEHTARAHLKSVLSKTDTHRQPDVVRMVAAGPGWWG